MNKIFIKDNLKLRGKTNETDIGIDIIASSAPRIVGKKDANGYWKSIDFIEYETHIFLDCLQKNSEEQLYVDVRPRSSICNYNLILANSVGLIDPEYRDQILVRFKYVTQPEDLRPNLNYFFTEVNLNKIYNQGDKIAQIVIQKSVNHEFIYVPELNDSKRGMGKFGSTGV